jgi:hypothetical protein
MDIDDTVLKNKDISKKCQRIKRDGEEIARLNSFFCESFQDITISLPTSKKILKKHKEFINNGIVGEHDITDWQLEVAHKITSILENAIDDIEDATTSLNPDLDSNKKKKELLKDLSRGARNLLLENNEKKKRIEILKEEADLLDMQPKEKKWVSINKIEEEIEKIETQEDKIERISSFLLEECSDVMQGHINNLKIYETGVINLGLGLAGVMALNSKPKEREKKLKVWMEKIDKRRGK